MTSEADRARIVNLLRSLDWLADRGLGLFCPLPADNRAVTCQSPVRSRRLRRQRLAGLLPDDVLGVPVRPVHIVLAGPLLVLSVRGRCAPERGRDVPSWSRLQLSWFSP